ncbi:MAG: hypothetical protein WCO61_02500 [Alphaproteobacteria bacterium]
MPIDRFAFLAEGFAMFYASLRYPVIAIAIILLNLLFSPVDAYSKTPLNILPCEAATLPSQNLTHQTQNECRDKKSRRVSAPLDQENKNGSTNESTPSGGGSSNGGSSNGGSSNGGSSNGGSSNGGSSGGGSSNGGSSGGGGVEPPLPPEVPGRLIVEQTISVTYQMSMVGYSFGNSHTHEAKSRHGAGNTLSAADITYGIGVGVATNGQSTLLAIGGAFAGTVATTNMTQASATSSGQGLGKIYSFSSPLPTPTAGEVIRISQMISVVVNNTMPVSSPNPLNSAQHQKSDKPVQQANADTTNTSSAATVVAVDQAILKAGATLSQNASDALVSVVVLTGSTTIITGTAATPVTAHAVGVAGGAALTTSPTPVSNTSTPISSSSSKAPIEIIQTLSVSAETVIAGPATTPQQQVTTPSTAALPSQTVDMTATVSQIPSPSKVDTKSTTSNAPVVANTNADGSSTTVTQASSAPSSSSNQTAINEGVTPSPKQEHLAVSENKDEKKKSSESNQAQQQTANAHSKEQKQDMKKDQSNPASADANQKTSPKTPDTSTPKAPEIAAAKTPDVTAPTATSVKAPTAAPSAPATPSTAQAVATGAGSATIDSGALSVGAGAQAQSGAQSTGPSQSSPAQAAASGASVAGAGGSSTTPTQTVAANGVSLASTGATLQKSP